MFFPVNVWKTVTVSGNYVLYCDDIYHAMEGYSLNILGNPYEIISFDEDLKTITVKGNTALSGSFWFNMNPVYFFHGSPRETNAETAQQEDSFKKTPMIWLLESFDEEFFRDTESAYERESSVRLFFLGQAEYDKPTAERHTNYVNPMRRLKEQFIEALYYHTEIFAEFEVTDKENIYTKFAVYVNSPTGSGTQQLFADNLAGVELSCTFKILKRGACCGSDFDFSYLATENEYLLGTETGVPIILINNE